MEGALEPSYIFVTLGYLFGSMLCQHVADDCRCAEVGYLVEVGDTQVVAKRDVAAVGILFRGDDFEQSALACAVLGYEAYLVTLVYAEGYVLKKHTVAVAFGERLYL